MNILVTGGAGFIGNHLVRRLLADRLGPVTVLDNFHRARPGILADCPVRLLTADLRDPHALSEATRDVDLVFHLAAQSSVMGAAADTAYTFDANVTGTFLLLQACARNNVRRVVFASSREVYGEADQLPVPESAELRPKNAYGASKVSGEAWCRAFRSATLETVILRLANVYGPGDSGRVIPLFVESALAGNPLLLHGGQQVLDFVWIDDVVESLLKAATGPSLPDPVNIGSGRGTAIADLCRRVLVLSGSRSTVEIAPARGIEVSRFVADISLARRVLALEPPLDPLRHLSAVIESFRRELQPVAAR